MGTYTRKNEIDKNIQNIENTLKFWEGVGTMDKFN